MIDLVAIASRHSQRLFGESVEATDLRLTSVARATRHIYQLTAARPHLPAVIAKVRLADSSGEGDAAALEAGHEFAVLASVHAALEAVGRPENTVTRPLLVLPDEGLIFMARIEGRPVAHSLRRWTVGLRSTGRVAEQLRRCGEWLHAFSQFAPAVVPQAPPALSAARTSKRDRHHVYRLIGLSGAPLVDTMLSGIERRLTAYRDPRWLPRITAAYSRQFRDFGPSRDVQGIVHGKYSPADIFMHGDQVIALDFEQAGSGSSYLDVAYFLYQVYMTARWRPIGRTTSVARLRRAFMQGRSGAPVIDDGLVDCFIAYYLVNSLRPGGGPAGMSARTYASAWLDAWLRRVGA